MINHRIDIYISNGLKDSSNKEISIDDAKDKIAKVFSEYKIGFSINNQKGGYLYDDGTYIIENSLRITTTGNYSDDIVHEFVEKLKEYFNQESVLICKKDIDVEYM